MYLSIFFDYKEIHNNSSEALFLCLIRSWIIYKYIILCFQVFFRNWCDRNYIALMGVFFFNIFAVLYDVYVWCFTVYGDVAWFFSIDTTTTWLPFTQFFVSESVLQINIQVLLFFSCFLLNSFDHSFAKWSPNGEIPYDTKISYD